MDYFNDLLATFLSFDHVRILAVYWRIRENQKYLNLFSENERFSGLERHEGELIMTEFSLLGELSL